MKDDWWKYPNSFLKLTMNTGETKEVHREDINNDILESLVSMGDRLWKEAHEDEAALPFPGDYHINISWDAGTATFVITLVGTCSFIGPLAWPQSHPVSRRRLLQHSRADHFRRSLCRSTLCGTTGRPTLWLAQRRSNARRTRTCGDYSWSFDYRHAICRLSRCVEQSWAATVNCGRHAWCACHHLDYVCALFLVDLPRWPSHRGATRKRRT